LFERRKSVTIANDNKVYFWGCLIVILIPSICVCLLIACAYIGIIAITNYKTERENYKAAHHQYSIAMREGRGKDAIHWAERIHYHRYKNDISNQHNNLLGYAYELNGEYEKAIENYTSPWRKPGIQDGYSRVLDDLLHVPRVEYKLGRKRNAFLGYCQFANRCLIKFAADLAYQGRPVGTGGWLTRNDTLQSIRHSITMKESTLMRLTAFREYDDFLFFMEEEYEKLGYHEEYAEAMELFRAIASEFDERHSRHPHAAFDSLREMIRQERQAANAVTD